MLAVPNIKTVLDVGGVRSALPGFQSHHVRSLVPVQRPRLAVGNDVAHAEVGLTFFRSKESESPRHPVVAFFYVKIRLMEYSKNVQLVLDILKNEVGGDVSNALEKMTDDYRMTWMYQKQNGDLFPRTQKTPQEEMTDVYHIKGREYDIRNITESENVVMVEMIESYPDPKTGQMYRTPQVIVLEFEDGKIRNGRHYTDPKLSYMELTKEKIQDGLRDTHTKLIID